MVGQEQKAGDGLSTKDLLQNYFAKLGQLNDTKEVPRLALQRMAATTSDVTWRPLKKSILDVLSQHIC